jgi:AcrR family transcriptional regulator
VTSDSPPDARRGRPLRADARRNRLLVLAAAEEVFATAGVSVPIDEIARRAGVGAGTVYRHFPTKESLFEAIVVTRIGRLVDQARSLSTAADPGAAFFGFLTGMVVDGVAKRDLVDALAATGFDLHGATAELVQELRSAMAELLRRAQEAGAVRDDVAPSDLTALVTGISLAVRRQGGDAGLGTRLAAVMCDGLRRSS